MTETTNGFIVSEKDLELRGPGEVFGNRQSGLPEFATADLVADGHILEVAKTEAESILQQKNWEILPDYQPLVTYLGEQKEGQYFD